MYAITVGYYSENIRMTVTGHSQSSTVVSIDNGVAI